jgi:hypothetical protein
MKEPINSIDHYDSATTPRSNYYMDRTIESEGNVEVRGIKYYQRTYTDGCAELVRYNTDTKMWAMLCFPNETPPGQMEAIREAIRNNFDLSKGIGKNKEATM